jgi:hypothetical protein
MLFSCSAGDSRSSVCTVNGASDIFSAIWSFEAAKDHGRLT